MKTGIKKPVLIFLSIIFVFSVIIIAARDIQLPQIPYLNKKDSKQQSVRPKMAEIKVNSKKITIQYSELDLFMAECCEPVVKEVKTEKENLFIKMKGKATFPFSANFEGSLTPYIESEKIKFRLSDLVLGKVESPQMLNDKFSNLANLALDEKINSKYRVKDVKIEKDGIKITIE